MTRPTRTLPKLSSALEEKAYRDTWGKGVESYLQMLYERLVLLRELLSDRGSLFLHLAPDVSHLPGYREPDRGVFVHRDAIAAILDKPVPARDRTGSSQ